MPLFEWNAEYSVGVKEFDEQHKVLISLVNGLSDAMKAGKARETLGVLFDRLVDYAVTHFRDEEAMMQKYGYPEYVSHKAEHTKLVIQVLEYKEKFKKDSIGLSVEILTFLSSWIQNHIKILDKKYGIYFNEKGIS